MILYDCFQFHRRGNVNILVYFSEYEALMTLCQKNLILSGDAFTCKASPLPKQSPGLFWNSPLAKRPADKCGALPHTPPEALPLDFAKGAQPL